MRTPTAKRLLAGCLVLPTCAVVGAQNASIPTTSYAPRFTIPASANVAPPVLPNIRDPMAVDAQTVCPGYVAADVQKTATGFTAALHLAGAPCNVYGTDIAALNLTVEYQASDRLHVEILPTFIHPSNASFYILPSSLVPKPSVEGNVESDLEFSWTNDPTFAFTVSRKATGEKIFSTAGTKLVYENQFIEFVSTLPENYNLYGLGESIHRLRLGNNFTKTFYAADSPDTVDTNLYGTHPTYLETRYYTTDASGNLSLDTSNERAPGMNYTSLSHGVYLRNAHGQDVLLRPDNITWRTIGGSIDLYFFPGPSQPEVTASYLNVVGRPALQQFWTFGFHQTRWGYTNISQLQDVVDNYSKFNIPLESVWSDIDYMKSYRDFEADPVRFNYTQWGGFIDRLHASGRYYVPIVDSAIYIPNPENQTDAYPVFDRGNSVGAFITNPDGTLYIGDVWPGYTVFPDWLSEGAGPWWTNEFVEFHKQWAFDGAWVDMSEVSSFCVGSCGSGNLALNPVHPPFALPGEPQALVLEYPEGFELSNTTEAESASASISSSMSAYPATSTNTSPYHRTTPTPGVRDVNYPPYAINNVKGPLGSSAISPNATHADGTLEYDVHNLWGFGILKATYNALSAVFPGIRPFIIGRGTFAGAGSVAGHWGGDNYSKWIYMFYSIPQALSMSLAGIPMFGVDTCGFAGNSDMELCSRWMQLSAFFPFYRNHNILSASSQEAYVWASVIDASKSAMSIRYQLLPYLYTLFYHAHMHGQTVMRALAWEFPNDPSLASADRQFLLGPAILVIPVLEPGVSTVNGVFPGLIEGKETWYDWYNGTAVPVPAQANTTIDAPLGHIPVYVRGGSVLPLQQPALTTREVRTSPWDVIIALDNMGHAKGDLYLDDGVSTTPNATLTVAFTVQGRELNVSINEGGWQDVNALRSISILGVNDVNESRVTFNGHKLNTTHVSFNKEKRTLLVSGFATTAWKGKGWSLQW
ncbi:glycosyl hydrolases family 31-domain-containing protein [Aspergillus tamarii]|uniref:alpha-glucosidase n=1 Tax=Aspergillus tamarii TaxID=41984 RepID=A0A5N6UBT3_ASPTM|nr:glycosyl hydrolases family 31-domain-containing protein [Aspergillus tamarii]